MTASFIFFFLLLLYIELLINGHSIQILFWSPETIEIFERGGESWAEGSSISVNGQVTSQVSHISLINTW